MNIKPEDVIYISTNSYSKFHKANVYWQPNRYCNYECSYCWETSHTKVKDFCDPIKSYKTIDDLCAKFKQRNVKRINWGWSGGEATFHPNFIDFQERILSHQEEDLAMTFNMTTNLAQSLKWWKEFCTRTKDYNHISIAASLHQEYVKTEKQIELFKSKLDFLQENNILITINQVMDVDLWDDQVHVIERFSAEGYSISPKINTILQKLYIKYGNGKEAYTKDQVDYLVNQNKIKKSITTVKTRDGKSHEFDSAEKLKPLKLHYGLHDFTCSAGYISIVIQNDLIQRGVSGCREDILCALGEDFVLLDEPKKCTGKLTEPCNCVADLKLPKWDPNEIDVKW